MEILGPKLHLEPEGSPLTLLKIHHRSGLLCLILVQASFHVIQNLPLSYCFMVSVFCTKRRGVDLKATVLVGLFFIPSDFLVLPLKRNNPNLHREF